MQESSMELQWRSSQLSGGNASYVEQLYESYLADPNTVPEPWRNYFEQLPRVNGRDGRDVAHSAVREQFVRLGQARRRGGAAPAAADPGITEHERKQVRVVQLISAYRQRGHQQARLDPLQQIGRASCRERVAIAGVDGGVKKEERSGEVKSVEAGQVERDECEN